ncbi:hypothetical protein DERF_000852, partial [Dermatophagoides farinae]
MITFTLLECDIDGFHCLVHLPGSQFFDQFNWRNAIPTSHVESVPRFIHQGTIKFQIFAKLAMTGKRHRKPFVDKWGKLSDIVNIRMQLFDIGAIFIFNLASKRFRSTFFTYDIGIKLNLNSRLLVAASRAHLRTSCHI